MKSRPPESSVGSRLSRRVFLATSAAAVGVACATPFLPGPPRRRFSGGIVGGTSSLGHALRDGKLPPVTETTSPEVVIVGGGIGGLAAARRLKKNGVKDIVLLELESRPGGNAISGKNNVSAYPWGAHYVPITGSDAVEVTRLFEELAIITGRDAGGLPIYHEEYLCADPMERLFIHGRWQDGLVPQAGLSEAEQSALVSFQTEMHRYQSMRGADGRRAFTIPLDASSRDEQFTRLDRITMADYLREKGWWESAPLRWYVNYCCRDDYGAGIEKISAWAGIHYFASRDGRAANAASDAVVTWPAGNGWLVQQLQAPLSNYIKSSCAVWNVETNGDRVSVDYYDAARQKSIRLNAKGVVWAAPQFIARHAIKQLRAQPSSGTPPVYSPWMVANLTLDALPSGRGMDLSWDNVMYRSNSLGYVVATHQNLRPVPKRTVITYYQPLDADEPPIARQKALESTYDDWCQRILADLNSPHPDISDHVTNLDVWLWGHAMVRPVPGYIWGPERQRLQQPIGNIFFAHSDLSGIAIFEEAYTRGVQAAEALLRQLPGTTSVN